MLSSARSSIVACNAKSQIGSDPRRSPLHPPVTRIAEEQHWLHWFMMILCTVIFIVCMFINVGMWLERFVIVVTSLHRDFMPSAWGRFSPTIWDWTTYIGTMGLFVLLLLLFLRFLPVLAIFEMRTLLPAAKVKEELGS